MYKDYFDKENTMKTLKSKKLGNLRPAGDMREAREHFLTCNIMARDMQQSRRLHEPKSMINHLDPITGKDIENLKQRPSLVDGNLTIYFESDETKDEYVSMPYLMPVERLPFNISLEASDRGG